MVLRLDGGWLAVRPAPGRPGHTLARWRYNFTCRPAWLAPVAERIGAVLLQREIDRRIDGFVDGCADPVVLAACRPG